MDLKIGQVKMLLFINFAEVVTSGNFQGARHSA